jgi:hypothetical protein
VKVEAAKSNWKEEQTTFFFDLPLLKQTQSWSAAEKKRKFYLTNNETREIKKYINRYNLFL